MTVSRYRGAIGVLIAGSSAQPETLTSSCGVSETWLAANMNEPPTQGAAPERGL